MNLKFDSSGFEHLEADLDIRTYDGFQIGSTQLQKIADALNGGQFDSFGICAHTSIARTAQVLQIPLEQIYTGRAFIRSPVLDTAVTILWEGCGLRALYHCLFAPVRVPFIPEVWGEVDAVLIDDGLVLMRNICVRGDFERLGERYVRAVARVRAEGLRNSRECVECANLIEGVAAKVEVYRRECASNIVVMKATIQGVKNGGVLEWSESVNGNYVPLSKRTPRLYPKKIRVVGE